MRVFRCAAIENAAFAVVASSLPFISYGEADKTKYYRCAYFTESSVDRTLDRLQLLLAAALVLLLRSFLFDLLLLLLLLLLLQKF